MRRFHQIEGEQVILRSKGVFRQVDLFQYGTGICGKYGAGWIRLMVNGKTSAPTVFWDDLEIDYRVGPHGYLVVS